MNNQLPDGITWPRFEDGELLKLGDATNAFDYVESIEFDGYFYLLHGSARKGIYTDFTDEAGLDVIKYTSRERLKRHREKYTVTADERKEVVEKLREYASSQVFLPNLILDALFIDRDTPYRECWRALADLIESGGSDD